MNIGIGSLITQRLEKLGWTQSTLAKRVKIAPSQVSRIIAGERGTSLETYLKIADALAISRETFLKALAGPLSDAAEDRWNVEIGLRAKAIKSPVRRHLLEVVLDSMVDDEEAG